MCCAEILFAWCYQTAEECQIFFWLWFDSYLWGKQPPHPGFPRLSRLEPRQRVLFRPNLGCQMEVQRRRECTEDFHPLLFPNSLLPYICIHPALLFHFPACSAWCLALWCLTHLYLLLFLIYCTLSQWLLSSQILAPFFTGWGVCEETEPFPWTFLPYYLHKWIPPKSTTTLEDQVQHLLTTIILYASQKIHLNQKKKTRTRARTARFIDLKNYFNWSMGPMYHFLNMKRQIGDAYKALYLSAETHVLVGPSACL